LVLPVSPRLAAIGMQLYPAQRTPARLVSGVLAALLRAGLQIPVARTTLPVWQNDPLVQFIKKLAGGYGIPDFAVLAGNPSTAGRRFVLLVWKPDGQAAGIVKAGFGPAAMELIEREEEFLYRIARPVQGIPEVLDLLPNEPVRAFAMPFIEGRNPPLEPNDAVESLLAGWVNASRVLPASKVAAWNALRRACTGVTSFEKVSKEIEAGEFTEVIGHGDFAPWNIRVDSDNRCVALDWERGAMPGMPGWDWFHYLIQSALLVQRTDISSLHNRLKALLASARFQQYAQKTSIAGRERQFLLAYLHYVVHVLRPAEGLAANQDLLERLAATETSG